MCCFNSWALTRSLFLHPHVSGHVTGPLEHAYLIPPPSSREMCEPVYVFKTLSHVIGCLTFSWFPVAWRSSLLCTKCMEVQSVNFYSLPHALIEHAIVRMEGSNKCLNRALDSHIQDKLATSACSYCRFSPNPTSFLVHPANLCQWGPHSSRSWILRVSMGNRRESVHAYPLHPTCNPCYLSYILEQGKLQHIVNLNMWDSCSNSLLWHYWIVEVCMESLVQGKGRFFCVTFKLSFLMHIKKKNLWNLLKQDSVLYLL